MPSVKKWMRSHTATPTSKREEKKRVNIQWNSGLVFQLSLIASLLLTFFIVEQHWGTKAEIAYTPSDTYFVLDPPVQEYKIEEVPVKKVEKVVAKPKTPRVIQPAVVNVLKEVVNTSTIKEDVVPTTEVKTESTTTVPTTTVKTTAPKNRNIMNVQEVPIFPGCDASASNVERRDCMNEKIKAFIARSFRVDKFTDKYLGETNRIQVAFTIDANGEVVNIQTRATHKDMEEEAQRVVGNLPKMTPAKHNGLQVPIMYSIPIVLNIEQ